VKLYLEISESYLRLILDLRFFNKGKINPCISFARVRDEENAMMYTVQPARKFIFTL
jgi:hypothetical protein